MTASIGAHRSVEAERTSSSPRWWGLASGPLVGRRFRDVVVPDGTMVGLWANRTGKAGLVLLAIVIAAVTIGPLLIGHDPSHVDQAVKLQGPDSTHLAGTDQYGRDQLSRLLDGGRRSMGAALLVLTGTLAISLTLGVVAGLTGRVIDAVVMRVVDVVLALPGLVFALAVVGVLGPGFRNLVFALVIASWAYYTRLVRSYVISDRNRPDVVAAQLAGVPRWRIAKDHIIPGVASQILVVATLDVGGIIVSIAGLSYLGLGVQPPDAEWGAMLSDSRLYFSTAPWLLLAPAIATVVAVTAFNLIGEALRDVTGARR